MNQQGKDDIYRSLSFYRTSQDLGQDQEVKGVVVNGVEPKMGLFSDEITASNIQINQYLCLDTFGHLS